jgi:hypothetical protein
MRIHASLKGDQTESLQMIITSFSGPLVLPLVDKLNLLNLCIAIGVPKEYVDCCTVHFVHTGTRASVEKASGVHLCVCAHDLMVAVEETLRKAM